MIPAADLIEATSDLGAFVTFSSVLKRIAVKLSKICNDLRLLNSGPRAGLGEIRLPAVQAGSSIMPGKVNPVIPEVVNQIAYQVIGNDLTVTLAAEAGQLQLNAMEPVVTLNILQSMRMLIRGMTVLREKCVLGIEADRERCLELLAGSLVTVTRSTLYRLRASKPRRQGSVEEPPLHPRGRARRRPDDGGTARQSLRPGKPAGTQVKTFLPMHPLEFAARALIRPVGHLLPWLRHGRRPPEPHARRLRWRVLAPLEPSPVERSEMGEGARQGG